ncbi:MAG: alpha/beta fold hydrolase [Bacteroidota bacterium]
MNTLLHSSILGEGTPLFILHGFLGMSDNWKTLGNKYAQRGFQVHLIDQRNHGRSFHSKDFDYTFLALDLKDYMDHQGLSNAHILGHSMGGKTAMQFAVTYSKSVGKLLIADIAPKYYPPHHQEIMNALKTLDFTKIDSRSAADQKLAESLGDFGIRQFLLKNLYWVEKGQLGLRVNLEVLQDKMEEIGENISGADTFSGPTLFLKGSRSEYIHQNDTSSILKHFPNASIGTNGNAGHWLHAENPSEFFDQSLKFLI